METIGSGGMAMPFMDDQDASETLESLEHLQNLGRLQTHMLHQIGPGCHQDLQDLVRWGQQILDLKNMLDLMLSS